MLALPVSKGSSPHMRVGCMAVIRWSRTAKGLPSRALHAVQQHKFTPTVPQMHPTARPSYLTRMCCRQQHSR
jgi:hypothetical protein